MTEKDFIANNKTSRNHALDALKIVAICCIVFHHYQQITGAVFSWGNFYNGRFYFGYLVELFFILSGFFMIRYISRIKSGASFKSFYVKRAARLLPLVAIAAVCYEILVLVWRILYHEPMMGKTLDLWGMIIDSLGVQAGWCFTNPMVNNPTWYVSVLLLCYIVFFAASKASVKLKVSEYSIYAAIIAIGLSIDYLDLDFPFLNSLSGRGYVAFFVGLFLGKLLQGFEVKKSHLAIGISIIVIFCFALKLQSGISNVKYLLVFVVYPATITILHYPAISKALDFRWIGTISQISFNVYIWHGIANYILIIALKSFGLDGFLLTRTTMIVFLFITFAIGTISHFCIERPIEKAVKNSKIYKSII